MRRLRLLLRRLKSRLEGWMLPYLLIVAVSSLSGFLIQMLSTVLPLYCVDIGRTTADAGLFAGFYSAALILSRPFVGKWTDERGKGSIAAGGLLLMLVSALGMRFLPSLRLFPVYEVLEGAGYSALSTALAALLLDLLPAQDVVRGIGLFTVFKSLSISLGASFAVSFAEKNGVSRSFGCLLLLAAVCVLLTLPLMRCSAPSAVGPAPERAEDGTRGGIGRFVEKGALPVALLQFLFTFSLTLGTNYLPAYAQTIGLGGIGIYYTVSAFTMLATRTLLSRPIEMLGSRRAYLLGMGLASATTAGVLLARSLPAFVVLAVLNAVAIGIINPLLNVRSTANVPVDRRGVASSTYYAALDLGSGAGGMIWGFLIPLQGYDASFIAAAAVLALAGVSGLRQVEDRKE